MTNHRMRDELDTALGGLTFSPSMQERVRARCGTEVAPLRAPLRLTRRAAVVLAVCALLTVAALAVGPTLWAIVQGDLGPKSPYATEVLASCEDQGIRIEAVAALADSRVTRLYFTMQDLTGDRLKEDTDWDLMLSLDTGDGFSWGNGGKGEQVLSYDSETKTAAMVFSRGTDELSTDIPTRAKLDMSWLTPGRRSASLTLDGEEVPSLTLESAVTAAGRTVLLPDQNPLPLHRRVGPQVPGQVIQTEAVTEVSISSMGFAADGKYHIRFRQDPDISPAYASEHAGQPLFNVRYYLHDPEEPDHWPSQEMDDVEYTQVEDGWDFCLPSLTPDTLPYLRLIVPSANYSVAGGRVEGKWELTVPVEAVEQRTATPEEPVVLPFVFHGETPFQRRFDTQIESVIVSPLSVVVNCVTPEGQEEPCQLTGEETSLTVALSDGMVLTPAYYSDVWSQRVGWIMWEFDASIEPDAVASVTIEGHTVPFP